MELTQLQYFVAVAKSLHMTRSAEHLHVAQPALSQAIARLERELGVPLFKRERRQLSLTVYGAFMLERLQTPLSVLERIPEELAELSRAERSTVRLNVLAATSLVTDAIIAYRESNPGIHFQLTQSADAADCDITVTTGAVTDTISPQERAFEEKIYLAVSRHSVYGEREALALAELAEESFISLAGSRQLRGICDRFCQQVGFTPKVGFESDNPASVKKLIAARAGVGFWPAFSFGNYGEPDVRLLTLSDVDCRRLLVLKKTAYGEEKAEAAAFFDFLCRFVQQKKIEAERRV